MDKGQDGNRKYLVLNGWKGIFALFILMLHFEAVFIGEQKYFETGYLAVEGFFIISGFLLGKTNALHSRNDSNVFALIWHKMKKIYPAYLYTIAILIGMFLVIPAMKNFITIDPASLIGELLMMQMTGIFPLVTINPICWYISVLMICTFLILSLVSVCKDHYYKIIAPIAIVVCYSYLIQTFGTLDIYAQRCGIFWGGLIRGFGAMNIGILLFYLTASLKEQGNKIFWNILEICSTLWILWALFGKKHSPEDFLILIPIVCMMLCAVQERGLLSGIFRSRPFQILGDLSFFLYITQLIIMYAMKIFAPQLAGNRVLATLLYLGLQIVFCLISRQILDFIVAKIGKKKNINTV